MTAPKTTSADFRCMMCGGRTPVELAVENEAASRAVTRCLQSLGDVGRGMLAYMALHRPPKRTLTWEKVARLLDELLTAYDRGTVSRDGATTAVTDALWIAALAETRDAAPRLDLPLTDHGYLMAVLAGMARKAQRAGDAVKRGETTVGYSAAHAPAQAPASVPHEPVNEPPVVPMPAEARAMLANFGKHRRMDAAASGAIKEMVAAAASSMRAEINPRDGAKPKAVVATFATVDNRKQLVEIIGRKGKSVTVKLLEAAAGFENTVVISVKDLL